MPPPLALHRNILSLASPRLRPLSSFAVRRLRTAASRPARKKRSRLARPGVQTKRLDVAVVGLPNAGKSMLLNKLIGEKVSAVSRKRHTTREATLGVGHFGRTELVFVDAPGVVAASEKPEVQRSLVRAATAAVDTAQVALLVVDAARNHQAGYGEPEKRLRQMVQRVLRSGAQLWLVLNKVDLVQDKRHVLIPTTDYFFFLALQEYETMLRAGPGGDEVPVDAAGPAALAPLEDVAEAPDEDDEDDEDQDAHEGSVSDSASGEESGGSAGDNGAIVFTGKRGRSASDEQFEEVTLDDEDDAIRSSPGGPGAGAPWRLRDLPNKSGRSRRGREPVADEDARTYVPPQTTLPTELWPHIEVFYLDAFRGEGVDELRSELVDAAVPAAWAYDRGVTSDLSFEERVQEIVREKLYRNYHREIPYSVQLKTTVLERSSDFAHVKVTLSAETKSQTLILRLTKSGRVLEYVRQSALNDLRDIYQLQFKLDLVISKPRPKARR